jgi:N-acetylneuraminic acid mutarotase
VFADGTIVISGGVDARTALHTNPATHPGINNDAQVYNTKDDSWQLLPNLDLLPARVTLPVAFWNGRWVYVSGEVKPGIRTNTVISVQK